MYIIGWSNLLLVTVVIFWEKCGSVYRNICNINITCHCLQRGWNIVLSFRGKSWSFERDSAHPIVEACKPCTHALVTVNPLSQSEKLLTLTFEFPFTEVDGKLSQVIRGSAGWSSCTSFRCFDISCISPGGRVAYLWQISLSWSLECTTDTNSPYSPQIVHHSTLKSYWEKARKMHQFKYTQSTRIIM